MMMMVTMMSEAELKIGAWSKCRAVGSGQWLRRGLSLVILRAAGSSWTVSFHFGHFLQTSCTVNCCARAASFGAAKWPAKFWAAHCSKIGNHGQYTAAGSKPAASFFSVNWRQVTSPRHTYYHLLPATRIHNFEHVIHIKIIIASFTRCKTLVCFLARFHICKMGQSCTGPTCACVAIQTVNKYTYVFFCIIALSEVFDHDERAQPFYSIMQAASGRAHVV